MARKKRKVPEVNSSSTADIAFILLIFFLTATSMNTDKGLARRLPPPVPEELKNQESLMKKRNVLRIRLNDQNQLLCQDEVLEVVLLKDKVKEFILNVNDDPDMPEKVIVSAPIIGDVMSTKKHVISIQSAAGTRYEPYITVQNEIVRAYNEIRNEFSKAKFGNVYDLLEEDQQKAVREVYPMNISEAEPRQFNQKGGK